MFEKVNPAHPDKVADRIAGAMVDLAYTVYAILLRKPPCISLWKRCLLSLNA